MNVRKFYIKIQINTIKAYQSKRGFFTIKITSSMLENL